MSDKSCLLIVDDEERGRDALEMLLTPENYQLAFATHGEEALRLAAELIPDLILLDVMMPGMDGFEVCERLRTHPTLAEVPVIMLTALDDRDSRLRGIEAGADDFITKPFDRVELRTRIRTITRLNRHRRLLAERSRLEWVVEHSEDGYLLLGQGDMINYANPCARLYLDLPKQGPVNRSFLQQIQQQHYHREPVLAWKNWPAPSETTEPRYLVRSEIAQDASLWLQVDILELPFDKGGLLVHLRDVSEQMNLQRQIWTFQTLVSHKLRAPLNGLVSLQILEKIDLSTERAHALLKIARESAARLQDQILDILKYIDTSGLLKEPNDVFSLRTLPGLLQKIKEDLELKTVTLSMDEAMQSKTMALSQQGMELILRELLTNSKKFHPKKCPEIDVMVRLGQEQNIILQVIDNGQCLSPQEMNKVWTPYYQIEKSFTGEIKGMGLGLAMIAKLVWGSGGTCQLRNREDQPGLIISLMLPSL